MNNLNNQKNQFIILAILLLVIGIANYFNYYAPAKPIEKIFSFSSLSSKEQKELLDNKNRNISDEDTLSSEADDSSLSNKKLESDSYSVSDNYINYAIDSNGKLVKWNKKKITVFVSDSEYKNSIYKALSKYNDVFKDYFKFYITSKRDNADIIIDVVDHFDSNDNKDSIYMAGLTNNSFSSDDKYLSKSFVKILSKKPNSNVKVTSSEVYNVAIHELGHAIGIIGHSPKNTDVMYASSNVKTFSSRDIATIKILYSNDQDLINRETKNYAETKLKEAELYAKHSPKKAISWVNLGRVYYDLGRKEDALEAYKKALELENNNPLIYQSMGECYYTSKKYDSAIKYYQYAVNYTKNNEERVPLLNMLGMCEAKKYNYNNAYIYFKQAYYFDKDNEKMLNNYLVACVETNKKEEVISVIDDYKSRHPNIIEEPFIKDVMNWAK